MIRAMLTTQMARAWFKTSPLPGAPSSVVSRGLSSQPLLPPSPVADAPSVAILDPVLTVPERGFARSAPAAWPTSGSQLLWPAKVFKKYSQMKLQMKREALIKLNRQANEQGMNQDISCDTARVN